MILFIQKLLKCMMITLFDYLELIIRQALVMVQQ